MLIQAASGFALGLNEHLMRLEERLNELDT
jgi:hypothetical protein